MKSLTGISLIVLAGAVLAAGSAFPGEDAAKVTTVKSDRKVEKDLEVEAGEKLVISPGVTLKFSPGVGVVCRGVLEARGRSLETSRRSGSA